MKLLGQAMVRECITPSSNQQIATVTKTTWWVMTGQTRHGRHQHKLKPSVPWRPNGLSKDWDLNNDKPEDNCAKYHDLTPQQILQPQHVVCSINCWYMMTTSSHNNDSSTINHYPNNKPTNQPTTRPQRQEHQRRKQAREEQRPQRRAALPVLVLGDLQRPRTDA